MKDALGKELEIGDFVAVTTGHYKQLFLCQVIDITEKMVRIHCLEEEYNYTFYWSRTRVLDSSQMVKVEL